MNTVVGGRRAPLSDDSPDVANPDVLGVCKLIDSRIRMVAMAGATAVLLASAVVSDAAETNSDPLSCAVRTTSENGLVRLEAVAIAKDDARGSYRLLIAKSGAAGTTRNIQSGKFDVKSDETRVLSRSSISVGPNDRYAAELTIEWNGKTRRCTAGSDTKI